MEPSSEAHEHQAVTTETAPVYAAYVGPSLPASTNGAADLIIDETGLPRVERGADLAKVVTKKRWVVLCFYLSLIVYLVCVPQILRRSSPPTGDQAFYLMVVASIVQDGDLDLANNYANHDEDKFYSLAPRLPGYDPIGAPYPLPTHLANATARPNTEEYDYHLPGLALALAPAWIVGSWFSLWWPATVVFMCLVGALLALNVFLLAHEMSGRLWIAWAVWLPIAFSNPIMNYSLLIFSELPVGLLLIYAFRRLALGWEANGWLRLLLVGLCIAYIPWLAWRCLPLSVTLLVYAAIQWRRYHKDEGRRTKGEGRKIMRPPSSFVLRPSSIYKSLWVAVPIDLSAALLASYNLFLFGKVTPDVSVPERVGVPFHWPWAGFGELRHFMSTAFGLLFDQTFGLLPFAPVYLLAVVGMIAMLQSVRRADRRLLMAMALIAFPYLVVITAFDIWDGSWCPPARFLTSVAPLAAAPLAMAILACRSWLFKAIYGALALCGLVITVAIMVYEPLLMWPLEHNRIFNWLAIAPQWPLRIDIRAFTTDYLLPDLTPDPTASALNVALALVVLIVCYLLLARGRTIQSSDAWTYKAQGAAWSVAILAVSSSWFLANYEQLQHKTVLVKQNRWQINIPPGDPQGMPTGIAYADGKVYVTSFGQVSQQAMGEVGVLDINTGDHKPLEPVSTQDVITLTFSHPGDIQASSDGLLYLLNNGEGDQALYVMKPDGEVVRNIGLNRKTYISTGLYLAPGGTFYVSDMQAGSIIKYGKNGGDPQRLWGGKPGGYIYNNPSGVVVDGRGAAYAIESGTGMIYELDPNKEANLNTYATGHRLVHAVSTGDWLDLTCDIGLISFNIKDHSIQRSRFDPVDSRPISPMGLAYGPNNMLFIFDASTNTVTQYKVQH